MEQYAFVENRLYMVSEVFQYHIYFDMFNRKSELVELVLTAVAIYHTDKFSRGYETKQNKRITRIPIRCDNLHNLFILDKIKIKVTTNSNVRREGTTL